MTDGGHRANETVAVTGATGFVGREIVRELVERGMRVRALVRDAEKARRVLPAEPLGDGRIALVEGGVLEPGVTDALVRDTNAVMHLIGIIREAPGGQTFERMHVLATQRVIESAEGEQHRRGSALRYCHMSALGVSDEGASAYQKTKFEAEGIVRRSRLAWTIFRPGLIHGQDGEFMQMIRDWSMGRAAPWLFLPYFTRVPAGWEPPLPPRLESPTVSPVFVGDVARAFCDALSRPRSIGEIYPLAGPDRMTMPELLKSVRDRVPLGRKNMPVIGLPGQAAALKARAASFIGLGDALPFDEGMALMGAEDSVAETVKARDDLGFEPASFAEAFDGYAARL
ncbi:MAG: NAD(P)H-binding protein [Planctomycetota bacterium]